MTLPCSQKSQLERHEDRNEHVNMRIRELDEHNCFPIAKELVASASSPQSHNQKGSWLSRTTSGELLMR